MSSDDAVERKPEDNTIETTGVNAGASKTPTKTPWSFRLRLMAALVIPVFLETLDYTVVATAQPHIASNFNRLDLQGWIGTAYLLTSTVFLPLYGSFSDVFGRHWALQSSLIWFIAGSALSTGAQNMPMMLAGRGIAGVGAAGLTTVVRVILSDSRSLNENTWQSTMMTVLYAVGYSTGPVIGGFLTSVSFRWVFAINLPCSVVAMVLIFILLRGKVKGPQPSTRQRLRESRSDKSHRYTWVDKLSTLDFIGATLFIGGGILILLGLNWGSTEAWNQAKVIASFVVGGLLFVFCMVWEWLIEHYDDPERGTAPPRVLEAEPMLPVPVFRNWDTIICQYTVFTSGMVMLVSFYFAAIFFTVVSGQDATKAGVQLIFFAPGIGVGVIASVNMIRFFRQPKYPIILGTLILPISIGLISMGIENNKTAQINGFMAFAGVGTGLTFAPTGIHARFSQPANRVAVVESLQLFFRTLGGTVGLAQCATVLNSKVKSSINQLILSGAIPPSSIPSANIGSLGDISSLPPPVANAIRDAFRNGTRWAFISLIPWTGLAVFMTLFLSKIEDTDKPQPPVTTATHEEEKTHPTSTNASRAEIGTNDEEELGDPPSKKGVFGPIGLIIYLVKKRNWEARRRKFEERRGATTNTQA